MASNITRLCPDCSMILTYSSSNKRQQADRLSSKCFSCSHRKVLPSMPPHNCPTCGITLVYKTRGHHKRALAICARCRKCAIKFRSQNNEWKQSISNSLKGKSKSTEHRRKLRLATISNLTKLHKSVYPYYNPLACNIIDEYGKQHGYNFQHALNGGEFHIKELGYWVDGYDIEQNVVIEYDEPAHKYKQTYDKIRQKEIERYMGCTFIRISGSINGT